MRYTVVFEKSGDNYAAFVPDLPGCVATGKTKALVERNIREAIAFHLEGMKTEGEAIPEARAWAELIEA
jgi:predicted RNase H-like HicB family nuclease